MLRVLITKKDEKEEPSDRRRVDKDILWPVIGWP